MTFLRIVIPFCPFVLSMILSENRYPLFRIIPERRLFRSLGGLAEHAPDLGLGKRWKGPPSAPLPVKARRCNDAIK
jgi:hypothetical protein